MTSTGRWTRALSSGDVVQYILDLLLSRCNALADAVSNKAGDEASMTSGLIFSFCFSAFFHSPLDSTCWFVASEETCLQTCAQIFPALSETVSCCGKASRNHFSHLYVIESFHFHLSTAE